MILTLLGLFYTLYFAAGIILPFVLALVLAAVLGPAMRLMNRRLHIPRMIVALLLIIALFSVVGALGYALSVPASAWIAKAPQSLSALMDKLSFLQRPIQLIEQGVHELQNAMSPGEQEPAGQQVVTVKQPCWVVMRWWSGLSGSRWRSGTCSIPAPSGWMPSRWRMPNCGHGRVPGLPMAVGIAAGIRRLRLAALAIVGLTTAKVFLVDMSGLVGLWRVLSFLGLGLVLIGLGAAYQRLVAPRPQQHA